jgi:hypothetical protein
MTTIDFEFEELKIVDTIEIIPDLKEVIDINWLLAAACKDKDRPVILCLHVRENGTTEAVDGYTLHQVRTPACLRKYEGKLLLPEKWKATSGKPFRFHILDDVYRFPNTDMIMPQNHEIRFQIQLDPRMLTNAIQGFTGRSNNYDLQTKLRSKVTLNFIGPTQPILIVDEEGRKALIMPVFSGKK